MGGGRVPPVDCASDRRSRGPGCFPGVVADNGLCSESMIGQMEHFNCKRILLNSPGHPGNQRYAFVAIFQGSQTLPELPDASDGCIGDHLHPRSVLAATLMGCATGVKFMPLPLRHAF